MSRPIVTVALGTDGLYRQAVEVAVLTVYGRLVIPAVVWPVQLRELRRATGGEAGLTAADVEGMP